VRSPSGTCLAGAIQVFRRNACARHKLQCELALGLRHLPEELICPRICAHERERASVILRPSIPRRSWQQSMVIPSRLVSIFRCRRQVVDPRSPEPQSARTRKHGKIAQDDVAASAKSLSKHIGLDRPQSDRLPDAGVQAEELPFRAALVPMRAPSSSVSPRLRICSTNRPGARL
jgi:hypothetical protein